MYCIASKPVMLEMDAAVHSLQSYNSITAILNCSVRSIIVVIIEKFPSLHKQQFNAQLFYILQGINRSFEVQLHSYTIYDS